MHSKSDDRALRQLARACMHELGLHRPEERGTTRRRARRSSQQLTPTWRFCQVSLSNILCRVTGISDAGDTTFLLVFSEQGVQLGNLEFHATSIGVQEPQLEIKGIAAESPELEHGLELLARLLLWRWDTEYTNEGQKWRKVSD